MRAIGHKLARPGRLVSHVIHQFTSSAFTAFKTLERMQALGKSPFSFCNYRGGKTESEHYNAYIRIVSALKRITAELLHDRQTVTDAFFSWHLQNLCC